VRLVDGLHLLRLHGGTSLPARVGCSLRVSVSGETAPCASFVCFVRASSLLHCSVPCSLRRSLLRICSVRVPSLSAARLRHAPS
jgi:hypothetical protein